MWNKTCMPSNTVLLMPENTHLSHFACFSDPPLEAFADAIFFSIFHTCVGMRARQLEIIPVSYQLCHTWEKFWKQCACHELNLHHRRPQTVGRLKEGFEEHGQTHEIAATGIAKMSATSAGNRFTSIFFGFACFVATINGNDEGNIRWSAKIWVRTLEPSSIGPSNWICRKHRRAKVKDDIILHPGAPSFQAGKQLHTRSAHSTFKKNQQWYHLP